MIKKISLILFVLIILIGGYFYFFPMYLNYDIPDEYFHSKHYDKEFSSQENGFGKFVDLIKYLEKQEHITQFDKFAHCLPQANRNSKKTYIWEEGYTQWETYCVDKVEAIENVLSGYTSEEKKKFDVYLRSIFQAEKVGNIDKKNEIKNIFSSQNEAERFNAYQKLLKKQESLKKVFTKKYHADLLKNQEFKDELKTYFEHMDAIVTKSYISSLNLDVGVFDQEILTYTSLIQANRVLKYYILSEMEYGDKNIAIETYIHNYNNLLKIYNTMDANLIESLVFLTLISIQQDAGKYMIDTYDISSKNIVLLKKSFSQDIFGKEVMENSLRREYILSTRGLFEEAFNKEKLGFSLKLLFFYSEEETRNIAKYQYKQSINNELFTPMRLNGRNLIGRILTNSGVSGFQSHFFKSQALSDKQSILFDMVNQEENEIEN